MTDDAMKAVEEAARAARGTVTDLASVPDERLDAGLRAIADALGRHAAPVLAANEADMRAGREAGLAPGLLDRLRLDEARLEALAGQPPPLPDLPRPAPRPRRRPLRSDRTGGPRAPRPPHPHRATAPGGRDRSQLRGPPQRG